MATRPSSRWSSVWKVGTSGRSPIYGAAVPDLHSSIAGFQKPSVCAGTNVEAGMKIIKESGVEAFLTNDFTTGAKKAVELATA